jgi:hypothetical protein
MRVPFAITHNSTGPSDGGVNSSTPRSRMDFDEEGDPKRELRARSARPSDSEPGDVLRAALPRAVKGERSPF